LDNKVFDLSAILFLTLWQQPYSFTNKSIILFKSPTNYTLYLYLEDPNVF